MDIEKEIITCQYCKTEIPQARQSLSFIISFVWKEKFKSQITHLYYDKSYHKNCLQMLIRTSPKNERNLEKCSFCEKIVNKGDDNMKIELLEHIVTKAGIFDSLTKEVHGIWHWNCAKEVCDLVPDREDEGY